MLTSTGHWMKRRGTIRSLIKALKNFQRISILARYWGLGRRTVEQTRSIEIGALQRYGYFAAPKQDWLIWRREGGVKAARSLEWRAPSGMEFSCGSAIKSFTSGGRLVG
jgi:hypothetical protein